MAHLRDWLLASPTLQITILSAGSWCSLVLLLSNWCRRSLRWSNRWSHWRTCWWRCRWSHLRWRHKRFWRAVSCWIKHSRWCTGRRAPWGLRLVDAAVSAAGRSWRLLLLRLVRDLWLWLVRTWWLRLVGLLLRLVGLLLRLLRRLWRLLICTTVVQLRIGVDNFPGVDSRGWRAFWSNVGWRLEGRSLGSSHLVVWSAWSRNATCFRCWSELLTGVNRLATILSVLVKNCSDLV